MKRAVVVKTDGSVEESWADWDYQEINNQVGGWIEAVNFGDNPYFAYINEEGKMLNLPVNEVVTQFWYDSGQTILLGDCIVGNAVFFGGIDDEGNDIDAPPTLVYELEKYSRRIDRSKTSLS